MTKLPLILIACALALPALGAGEPIAPMLMLETGMHASGIGSISADATGRLVLTVGDNEARLWSLEQTDGRPSVVPLRVFRAGGELNWGALSPDGTMVALTGGSMVGKDGREIRLYDTTTGRFITALYPTGSVIELAFSDDGRLLAAGLRGSFLEAGGLNVFSLPSGNLVARGDRFLGSAYNLRWLTSDRLAASTDHGEFYLYDTRSWRQDTTVAADSVTKPLVSKVNEGDDRAVTATSISDDGSLVAIGSSSGPNFSLFGPDFSTRMFRPDTGGIHQTNKLSRLSWSRDAKVLAGAFFSSSWEHEFKGVRIWNRQGSGPPRDIPTGPGRANAMTTLPGTEGARFLVGTSHPASWSIIDANAGRAADFSQHFTSTNPDFSDDAQNSHFRVSDDGMTVAFGTAGQGRNPAVFSLADRKFAAIGDLAEVNARPPRPAPRGVKIAKRPGYSIVELNGKKLDTVPPFTNFCQAFAPDDSYFLLGAGPWLGKFDRTGKKIWGAWTSGTVVAVNLSSDGSVAVVACAGGTLEWLRTSDGDDFLTAYMSADRHRWVAWTNATEQREQISFDAFEFMKQLRKLGGRPVRIDGMEIGGDMEGEEEARELLGAESFAAWKRKRNQDVNKKDYDKAIESLGKKAGVEIEVTMLQRDGKSTEHRLIPATETTTRTVVVARYYDSAPSGEEFLAWRVARSGEPLADFFPAARFRSVYYRPDIIQRLAQARDANAAVKQANTALGRAAAKLQGPEEVIARLSPPVVELECGGAFATLEISADAPSAKVRYAIRQTGRTPATQVQIRLNGRPLEVSAPLPSEGGSAEVEVPLPDGIEGELGVIASHDLASSEAALLRIRRTGEPASTRKPDLFVIAVGVSKLQANTGLDTDGDGKISDAEFLKKFSSEGIVLDDLKGADADAASIGGIFGQQRGTSFGQVHSQVLVNEQATTAALRQAVRDFASRVRTGDVFVFSFAGHGYADEKREFFLATHDLHPDRAVETALTGTELAALLAPIKASVVLLLDTCQSGAVLGRQEGQKIVAGPEDLTGLLNTLSSSEQGIVVISSSSESELSFEAEGGGYFTRAVVEGMQGAAAKNGAVTCAGLQDFVSRRVPVLLKENAVIEARGLTQTPTTIMPKGVPDFVLAKP